MSRARAWVFLRTFFRGALFYFGCVVTVTDMTLHDLFYDFICTTSFMILSVLFLLLLYYYCLCLFEIINVSFKFGFDRFHNLLIFCSKFSRFCLKFLYGVDTILYGVVMYFNILLGCFYNCHSSLNKKLFWPLGFNFIPNQHDANRIIWYFSTPVFS